MRLRSLFALVGITGLSLAAIACGGSSAADNTSDPSADTADGANEEIKAAVIGEESNGKSVDVNLGRSFTIALEDDASTGYTWQVIGDGGLGAAKQTEVPGDVSRPGAPGTAKFTWSTKSATAGAHTITLEQVRRVGTTPPAATFTVTINLVAVSKAPMCGGFAGIACAAGTFCDYASSSCGAADRSGTCQARPGGCPRIVMPVCGCDGKTYTNGCEANQAGISVAASGACAGSN